MNIYYDIIKPILRPLYHFATRNWQNCKYNINLFIKKLGRLLPHKSRLIILDDTFPNLLSGFRIAQYNYLLEHFEQCEVYTTLNDPLAFEEYGKLFPQYIDRIHFFSNDEKNWKLMLRRDSDRKHSLFFVMFLHNTYNFLPIMEYYKIPYIIEMYSGGFLSLNETKSDNMLKCVCESKYLRNIIVNFNNVRDYIVNNGFVSPEKVQYFLGCITQSEYWKSNLKQKQYFPTDKDTFDICFIAHKVMPKGENKGYDVFVEIMKKLARLSNKFRFHVVGGHSAEDIDVSQLRDTISFYGSQAQDFFPEFYKNKDIVIILENPSLGSQVNGNTGGFPTVCGAQSAMNGVAVFAKDMTKQNELFTHRKNIVILDHTIDGAVEEIWYYFNHLTELYELSQNGQKDFSLWYSEEYQMKFRIQLINEILNKK